MKKKSIGFSTIKDFILKEVENGCKTEFSLPNSTKAKNVLSNKLNDESSKLTFLLVLVLLFLSSNLLFSKVPCSANIELGKAKIAKTTDPVQVTGPTTVVSSSCDYVNQAALNAAFNAWVAQFQTISSGDSRDENGGNTQGQFNSSNFSAPNLCEGGSVTLTYSNADNRTSDSVTATFTVIPSSQIVVNCGSNVTIPACSTQSEINAAWASFLASTTATGGCNGVLTNNAPSAPPAVCGGYVDVTWTYTAKHGCSQAAPLLILNDPLIKDNDNGNNNGNNGEGNNGEGNNGDGNNNGNNNEGNNGDGSTTGGSNDPNNTIVSLTCTKRFTIATAVPVDVNGPADLMSTSCQYQDQAAVDAAFAAWTAQFVTVNAGCGATAQFNNTEFQAPSLCEGGSVTLTYSIAANCSQDSVTSTFSLTHGDAVNVSGPVDVTSTSCQYQDQAAVDAAFAAWTAQFVTVNAGCGATAQFNNTEFQAPSLCEGGSVTLTYSIADNCSQDSVTATFSLTHGDSVDVSGPADSTSTSCQYTDQAAVDEAFAAWTSQFVTLNAGCNATAHFNTSEFQAPRLCEGGSQTLTYSIADNCSQDSVTSTFSLTHGDAVDVSGPADSTSTSCQYADQRAIDAAFTAWLSQFVTVNAGCNAVAQFNTSEFSAPKICQGGTVSLTYIIADNCSTDSVSATFTIQPAPAVDVVGPDDVNSTTCTYANQAAVDAAFASWIAQFKTANVGCGATAHFDQLAYVAPVLCEGGSVSVTYSIADSCTSDSVTATFAISQPSEVVFNCGNSVTMASCSSQAEVNAAWAAFLASTTATGGCNGVLTNNAPLNPPSLCGGFVDVTWKYTTNSVCKKATIVHDSETDETEHEHDGGIDDLHTGATYEDDGHEDENNENIIKCTKRFTIKSASPAVITGGKVVKMPACSSQAEINEAWEIFLGSTTATGGCNGVLTNNAPSTPPSICGGYVDVTWTYTYNANGCQTAFLTKKSTKRFTVTAPTTAVFTGGNNVVVPACKTQAQINTAWNTFMAAVKVTGGCAGGVLTNNAPATAPSTAAGYVDVTWTYTAAMDCTPITFGGQTSYGTFTFTKRFTVTGGNFVNVVGPSSVNYNSCSFGSQAALNAAFASWLAQFQTVSTGAEVAVFSGDPRVAPSLTAGGAVRVTYSIAGSCNQDVVNATFTVKRATNCGGCLTKVASSEAKNSDMLVEIYPNPFTGAFSFNLTTESDSKVVLSIYDMAGKLIENREVMPTEINALQLGDKYASGVYNVIVSQGTQVKTLRIIKR